MQKYLPFGNLPLLLRELQNQFLVFAPQQEAGRVSFKELVFPERIKLDYGLSLTPPSKEILFKKEVNDAGRKKLLFGVHLVDLEAIEYLDRIFDKPISDAYYKTTRENFIVVGVDYPNQEGLFFTQNKDYLKSKCDLFLDEVEGGYLAIIGTKNGQQIVNSKYFQIWTGGKQINEQKIIGNELLSDPQKLRKAVLNKDHPIWDEMAKKCLGCGICSYVCPLCFCFDRVEKNTLTSNPHQQRCESSCLLKDFHAVSGGGNFAPTIKERFYNWYYHKFVRMVDEYGQAGCVGCGRCIAYCPAKIDLYKNLQELLKDQN